MRTRTGLAVCLLAVGACSPPDLGECDDLAARELAYVQPFADDVTGLGGLPMFEGQALLTTSCGNGQFCHADVSSPQARNGAFAGWSLDLRPACDARAPAAGCRPMDRDRLRAAQGAVYYDRHAVMAQVESGAMPPGAAADEIFDGDDWPHFARADGTTLPGIQTEEGRAIFRNWLACGAPLVERVEDLPAGSRVGDYCGDDTLGDCVYGGPKNIEPPLPTWESIYARLIMPACVSCHGEGDTDYRLESMLDLSDIDYAYEQIVGVVATGAFCRFEDATHVVPGMGGSATSLFYLKLTDNPVCGDRMPLGGPYLPESVLASVRVWIETGAAR